MQVSQIFQDVYVHVLSVYHPSVLEKEDEGETFIPVRPDHIIRKGSDNINISWS